MRRTVVAGLVALALALGACGGDKGSDSTTTSPDTNSSSTATATGSASPTDDTVKPVVSDEGMPTLTEADGNPILAFPSETPPDQLQMTLVEEGTGATVGPKDFVIANYEGQVWGNSLPFDSSFVRGKSIGFPLTQVVKGWTYSLTDRKVGDKLIVSIPADLGYGPSGGNANAGISATDTIAFYIEIVGVYGANQAGQADAKVITQPEDLPVVVKGALGEPFKVNVKEGQAEPTEVKVTTIAEGSGEPVGGAGTSAYLQYTLTFWDNSTAETSFDVSGPQAVTIGGGTVFDMLQGVPVGSRVLLEIPAQDGSSGTTSPAFAVVVDILGQM